VSNHKSDLLAFQLSHFGDDTQPETWFVEAEVALSYKPECDGEEEEDDELGFYYDGVKRTLTDEQIDMFRHSEMQQLIREGALAREEQESIEDAENPPKNDHTERALSPASSIEEELLDIPAPTLTVPPTKKIERQPSPSNRSDSTSTSATRQRQREKEVPYDQRKKRKWEGFIEDIDPEHGSRTHRRIVRELDEQRNVDVELDY
jgi:hypothetical protein